MKKQKTSIKRKLRQACKILGSLLKLASALGVEPPTVSQWLSGKRPIPTARCVQIEQLTNGVVSRKDLRPDDWWLHWPELVEKKAA